MGWEARCASLLGVRPPQVEATARLLRDDATIPFIVRYRAHLTGGLSQPLVAAVAAELRKQQALALRKQTLLRLCAAADESHLRAIREADCPHALEDLYAPFKPCREGKEEAAARRGLSPLARRVWREGVADEELHEALADEGAAEGVRHLLARYVSLHVGGREAMRQLFASEATLRCAAPPANPPAAPPAAAAELEGLSAPVRSLPSHRVLKINRLERRKQLRVSVALPAARGVRVLCESALPSPREGRRAALLEEAVADAYKRLVQPAMARYVRSQLTHRAEAEARRTFGRNLERLLLQRPLRSCRVLGVDPGFRSGSKLALIDEAGGVLRHAVVWALPPHSRRAEAIATLRALVREGRVGVVAIGTGTGGREMMEVVAEALRGQADLSEVKLCAVSEAGASVLSVSAAAAKADPHLDVGTLGAASIARRLQDPLAELVRLDPRSIGVGMYQHDVDGKALAAELQLVVQACVCAVGVDVNTASAALIGHVAGLNAARAAAIVAARPAGGYTSRSQLLAVRGIGAKSFEQAAGFLRVCGGGATEPLDATAVHPESYGVARALLARLSLDPAGLASPRERRQLRQAVARATEGRRLEALAEELGVAARTLQQVSAALATDWRDPREAGEGPLLLGSELRDIDQLQVGQTLHGVVRNVTPFGGFVDVGLKDDGLVHISELSAERVEDPHDVIEIGQAVIVRVVSIDVGRRRLGLSMKAASPSDTNTVAVPRDEAMELQVSLPVPKQTASRRTNVAATVGGSERNAKRARNNHDRDIAPPVAKRLRQHEMSKLARDLRGAPIQLD
ncbi:hypothetical protein AB1Y20_008842 [Prymnesium parvum]|uniref:S1 motif domain-containing protein n=1 Tax=Prymnesium parvum TaxID=97485 RepID=A0AB34IUA9_PRYPA